MPKFRVHGKVTGSAYMGEFEADTPEEAMAIANDEHGGPVSMCHHCSNKCEDAETEAVSAELISE